MSADKSSDPVECFTRNKTPDHDYRYTYDNKKQSTCNVIFIISYKNIWAKTDKQPAERADYLAYYDSRGNPCLNPSTSII